MYLSQLFWEYVADIKFNICLNVHYNELVSENIGNVLFVPLSVQ